jgi:hypothetical protein
MQTCLHAQIRGPEVEPWHVDRLDRMHCISGFRWSFCTTVWGFETQCLNGRSRDRTGPQGTLDFGHEWRELGLKNGVIIGVWGNLQFFALRWWLLHLEVRRTSNFYLSSLPTSPSSSAHIPLWLCKTIFVLWFITVKQYTKMSSQADVSTMNRSIHEVTTVALSPTSSGRLLIIPCDGAVHLSKKYTSWAYF